MVSVIIPFYNAEKHLKKSISSVLNQTYKDWELILVDDCGKDNAITIAENFAKKDRRISILRNSTNKGVDFSRFAGINNAKGEYVMFIDADDWIAPNAIESMLKKMMSENSDVVVGSMVRVLDGFGLLKSKPFNNTFGIRSNPIDQPELFQKFFITFFGINLLLVNMAGKLYRLSTIKKAGLSPSGMKMGEDLLFNMYLHPYLKRMSFVENTVYYYRFGGMTNTSNPDFLKNIRKQYKLKNDFAKEHCFPDSEQSTAYELVNCFFSHFQNRVLLDGINKEDLKHEVEEELKNNPYRDIPSIKDFERYDLIYSKNTEAIINYIWKQANKNRIQFKIKKIVSQVLGN